MVAPRVTSSMAASRDTVCHEPAMHGGFESIISHNFEPYLLIKNDQEMMSAVVRCRSEYVAYHCVIIRDS